MNASVLLVKALGGGWQKGESRQAAVPDQGHRVVARNTRRMLRVLNVRLRTPFDC